jgi:hypothetical protein
MLIEKYQLLASYEAYNLSDLVEAWIEKGYQPYGQPFEKGNMVCQAVVKYKTP